MKNRDMKLCADLGLSDRVREYVKDCARETIEKIAADFEKFHDTGRMPFLPNTAGLFAEVYNPSANREINAENIKTAAAVLREIAAEKKAEAE